LISKSITGFSLAAKCQAFMHILAFSAVIRGILFLSFIIPQWTCKFTFVVCKISIDLWVVVRGDENKI